MLDVKQFLQCKIVEEMKSYGLKKWATQILDNDSFLYLSFSGEIEEAIFYGKDIERPIKIVRDRVRAYLTGERTGEIRKTQFSTLQRMHVAAKQNDYQAFLKILLNGFHSEKSDQYNSRNNHIPIIVKKVFDDFIYFNDQKLEQELNWIDAMKLAKEEPLIIKERIFKFWLENVGREDFDDKWYQNKCIELGFDVSGILGSYINSEINVKQTESGHSQLVFVL
jgi:hypothetical protein